MLKFRNDTKWVNATGFASCTLNNIPCQACQNNAAGCFVPCASALNAAAPACRACQDFGSGAKCFIPCASGTSGTTCAACPDSAPTCKPISWINPSSCPPVVACDSCCPSGGACDSCCPACTGSCQSGESCLPSTYVAPCATGESCKADCPASGCPSGQSCLAPCPPCPPPVACNSCCPPASTGTLTCVQVFNRGSPASCPAGYTQVAVLESFSGPDMYHSSVGTFGPTFFYWNLGYHTSYDANIQCCKAEWEKRKKTGSELFYVNKYYTGGVDKCQRRLKTKQ